ncbi:hypothetical protein R84981_003010 [Carnimonas sp. R-84981]|uniref:hypothetical protein n=1 Tax=Carnimonas bestiolae TaxID=3402172 RepID=UPI003EDC161E
MTMEGAGDIAFRIVTDEDKRRYNAEAFRESAENALFEGRDYGAATHDGFVNRISDIDGLIEMLIAARNSRRWSDIERLIDEAVCDEIDEALKVGVAA